MLKNLKMSVFLGTVMLLVVLGLAAYATPSKPYGGYGCHFNPSNLSVGTAYTDKCSCTPVNNKLGARVKIQSVNEQGEYKNSSWSSWARAENVKTKYISKSLGDLYYCCYAQGEHEARCGDGKTNTMTSENSQ